MKVLFAGQVPKDPAYPDENEDALEFSTENNRVALSDGASESFDSKTWASLLALKFAQDPGISQYWINEAIIEYIARYDAASLTWSKQNAFAKGSFASLLGLEIFSENSSVEVSCVGDSLIVLLVDGEYEQSFPYSHFEDFQKRPNLFCTNSNHNIFFQSENLLPEYRITWDLASEKSAVLLCMTDALGEWALKSQFEGDCQWERLNSIGNLEQLEDLVISERVTKKMRRDDVTLIRIDPFGVHDDELPKP